MYLEFVKEKSELESRMLKQKMRWHTFTTY
jgi:hypothetical protein